MKVLGPASPVRSEHRSERDLVSTDSRRTVRPVRRAVFLGGAAIRRAATIINNYRETLWKEKNLFENARPAVFFPLYPCRCQRNSFTPGGNNAGNNKTVRGANREQITKLLSFVDGESNEKTKQEVFGKLGYECFYCTNAVQWIKSMNLNGLMEFVNKGKSSRWEEIQYDSEKSVIKVVGRKVPCDCAYAQGQQPPKSLCNYCCTSFMQELFGTILMKKVEVIIDETIILGGERCSQTIIIC